MSFNHRRKARILMCQALYQYAMTKQNQSDVVQQFVADNQQKKYDKVYFNDHMPILFGQLETLDALIQSVLIDRKVSEITPVELSVCRLGVYELDQVIDVPFKVIIAEALHIEKQFGTEDGFKFVNGVLDRLAARLRSGEYPKTV